jgi:AcrR family transcriptional regulator
MLLDAAEDVLREEGYAAFTSRNIAGRAGVNQQLLYYYFHTMEELIVAAFRRASERELARLEAAAESDHPLQAMWQVRSHKEDLRSMPEFAALANRIAELRDEVIAFRRNVRQLQVAALHKSLGGREAPMIELPPVALVALLDYVALYLNRESEFSVIEGQRELIEAFESFLAQVEAPADKAAE